MDFKVPQFIEIEDKIFGPFSFKQFLYLAGGAGIIYLLYKALPFILALIPILIVGGLSLALTFYRINDKPFIFILEAYFKYLLKDKLYIWKKDKQASAKNIPKDNPIDETELLKENVTNYMPKLSESKLKDISWSLDILDV